MEELRRYGEVAVPGARGELDVERGLSRVRYRGNNALYTFNVPASAFVSGANTLVIRVISGSSGTGFLSPGYSYDAVELD